MINHGIIPSAASTMTGATLAGGNNLTQATENNNKSK